MGEFRFKRFSVLNEKSAMKVNTDGVLLGALIALSPSAKSFLDIGTGTGTIALMVAQRMSDMTGASLAGVTAFHIRAIDIDRPSAEEAAINFSRSPWAGHLSAENISLDSLAAGLEEGTVFDHIFSNPPYFESELRSPDMRRREARHSESLSYKDIMEFSSRRLSPSGRCSVVLPSDVETDLCRYARMCGLFPFRVVRIRTVPGKPPRRIVAEFSRMRPDNVEHTLLTIQEEGRYTSQYTGLTSPFYVNM